jgi:methylase of polypeptide subunit release factors
MRVFISYSWKNEALRKTVTDHLSRLPLVEVIFDQKRIEGGDGIHPGISNMIDSADLVVAVVTNDSLASREVTDELARVNDRKKIIIPFVSADALATKLPFYLNDIFCIQFKVGGLDKSILELCDAVRKRTAERETRFFSQWRKDSSVFRSLDLSEEDLQRSNLGSELLEQVLVYCQVTDFVLNESSSASAVPLFISPNVFLPDGWTRALVDGIKKACSADADEPRILLDVGVGTGAIPISLHRLGFRLEKIVGLDVDSLACEVARINFKFHGLGAVTSLLSGIDVPGAIDKELIEKRDRFDLVVGNIPQVPTTNRRQIRDHFDFYPLPLDVRGEWALWARNGLWLIASTLRDIRPHISESGQSLFVVSGRPGEDHVLRVHETVGYRAKIISRQRAKQDPGTDISSLVAFERAERIPFVFYSDPVRDSRITAGQAHELMSAGVAVYQDLFVVAGKPL